MPPPRYHNFITHRTFVLKLPIFQDFYCNNFFNLNFCYTVFCGARNCIVWYINHIYDSIKRIFWNHLTHMLYDFFQECHRRTFFYNILYFSIADRFSFAALLICCRAMHSEPNCSFSFAVSCSLSKLVLSCSLVFFLVQMCSLVLLAFGLPEHCPKYQLVSYFIHITFIFIAVFRFKLFQIQIIQIFFIFHHVLCLDLKG